MAEEIITETNRETATDHAYGGAQIQVLEGLEAVRKRPGMYIGSTGPSGLHHLVYEIVDNAIDEALAGYCTHIEVTIKPGNIIEVSDNGRGIPVDIQPKLGIPAVTVVYTVLHAGGKFGGEDSGYKVAGGLHGVGASVVNALSEWLTVRVRRDGAEYEQSFKRGKPDGDLKKIGAAASTGTTVTFKPDPEMFTETKFSRLLIYRDTIDDILGTIHRKDFYVGRGITEKEVKDIISPAIYVLESEPIRMILKKQQKAKTHVAVVVDEYGGTCGIVTMEDILEEIVGNIQDEYDEEEIEMRKVSDAVYIIKGTADPDDILPQLGVTLPEGREFDTMSGFVVELLGRIPEAEETPSVQYESVLFTVLLIEDNWVSKIKAQILPPEPQKEEGMEKHGEEGK